MILNKWFKRGSDRKYKYGSSLSSLCDAYNVLAGYYNGVSFLKGRRWEQKQSVWNCKFGTVFPLIRKRLNVKLSK